MESSECHDPFVAGNEDSDLKPGTIPENADGVLIRHRYHSRYLVRSTCTEPSVPPSASELNRNKVRVARLPAVVDNVQANKQRKKTAWSPAALLLGMKSGNMSDGIELRTRTRNSQLATASNCAAAQLEGAGKLGGCSRERTRPYRIVQGCEPAARALILQTSAGRARPRTAGQSPTFPDQAN